MICIYNNNEFHYIHTYSGGLVVEYCTYSVYIYQNFARGIP